MNLFEKGKWKYIPIEKRYFDDNAFDGLGSMQVLTDYVYTPGGKIEKAQATPSGVKKKRGTKRNGTQAPPGKANVKEGVEERGSNVMTDHKYPTKKWKQKSTKMAATNRKSLKTTHVIDSVGDKTNELQDGLELMTVEVNKLDKKKQRRKTKRVAANARKKQAVQSIVIKELKTTTKVTNQEIKQAGLHEGLDPAIVKANRLEKKKLKRKAKKAAAIARKKEAAAQGIDIKELKTLTTKMADQDTRQVKNSQVIPTQSVYKKANKNQQKNNRKLAKQSQRKTVQSSIIDITDIDKHVDAGDLEKADKSQRKKRKIEDNDGPKSKQTKNKKKKTGKGKSTDGFQPNVPEENIAPKQRVKTAAPATVNMSKWKDLFVPEVVLKALSEVGFDAPTPIQCLTLPSAIRDRQDILGAAETGSGKTLAFGIPIIHNILQYKESHPDGALDSGSDNESEGDWDSGGEMSEGGKDGCDDSGDGDGESGDGDVDSDSDFGEAKIWGDEDSESDESEMGDDGFGDEEKVEDMEDKPEKDGDGEGNNLSGDEDNKVANESEDSDSDGGVEEESDDGGEYDLAPEDGEEYFELKDGELGCLAAVNNVSFDWMEEGGMETVDLADFPRPTAALPPQAMSGRQGRPLHCLILTPTRELAIQIKNHLQTACTYTDIKICCVVGGMASQKQERILRKCPEIVVATPGRFWELLQQGEPHLAKVDRLRALVIDEADRMVEKGHFEEMKNFMEFLKQNEKRRRRRQNFVFSATLTMVHKAPTRLLLKKKKVKQQTTDDKLRSLVEMIGLDPKAKVIDITRKLGTAEGLVESKINCTSDEKDIYLYYFLQRYPGRTLVFSNSKDCLRRLVSIFTLLGCKPLPLHADMHQRQRLKNLDKFKADPTGLLLATDVAARGLDIPNVEHVIHYQVPRTSENYVHRSGRTARASKEGLSVVLIGQEDMTRYRKITHALNRSEELGIFPVEQEFMVAMRQRIGLARKIDKEDHRNIKSKKQNLWFEKAAREMDIELDEEGLLNDLGDSQQQAQQKQCLASMRRDLATLLSQPVIPHAFSGRYPTKMGKLDMPLNTGSQPGDACAAVRKEATSNSRFNIGNTVGSAKSAKKTSKKKYRRKK